MRNLKYIGLFLLILLGVFIFQGIVFGAILFFYVIKFIVVALIILGVIRVIQKLK